jgi:hypothetical protein
VLDYRFHFIRNRKDGKTVPRHCGSVIMAMNCALEVIMLLVVLIDIGSSDIV